MRKVAPVLFTAILGCLSMHAQEGGGLGGVHSFGLSSTYSPNSSHILIGGAEQRRTWTAGFDYTHRLYAGRKLRVDYHGSVLPFFWESDPTIIGTQTTINRDTLILYQPPTRVIHINRRPIGTTPVGRGGTVPIYGIFSREDTYAAALTPVGARLNAFPRRHIQPSFSLDFGFVVSARDLPIDGSDQFNYLFSFGPGVQLYSNPRSSVRVEYLYRHISNAHMGDQNPGIDQGVFRVTLSRHR